MPRTPHSSPLPPSRKPSPKRNCRTQASKWFLQEDAFEVRGIFREDLGAVSEVDTCAAVSDIFVREDCEMLDELPTCPARGVTNIDLVSVERVLVEAEL